METPHEDYYGKGYQDIVSRKPSIDQARRLLGWEPMTDLPTLSNITLGATCRQAERRRCSGLGVEGGMRRTAPWPKLLL